MSDDVEVVAQGACSACGGPAERGQSGAWWHVGRSCWTSLITKPRFVPGYWCRTCDHRVTTCEAQGCDC